LFYHFDLFRISDPSTSLRTGFGFRVFLLTGLLKCGALGGDYTHELVPGIDERFCAFVLDPCGQGIEVDGRLGELFQSRFAVAAIGRHDFAEIAVIGEGFQCSLGHRVHRERRSERLDIEDSGGLRILGSRAGPKQALRTSAGVVDTLPARRGYKVAIRLVSTFGDGDAELIAQRVRRLARDRDVPTADEHGSYRSDVGLAPGVYAPLDTAQEGLGR